MSEQEQINKIADHILLKVSFVEDLGLYHGRMGLILFLAHYSQYAHLSHLEALIIELVEELFEDISPCFPFNLEFGLSGIGWGIDYLIKMKLVNGNQDVVLKNLDQELMKYDFRRIKDLSFERGLAGILYYVNHRILTKRTVPKLPFDSVFLSDLLCTVLTTEFEWKQFSYCNVFEQYKQCMLACDNEEELQEYPFALINQKDKLNVDINQFRLGLADGMSGLALRLIQNIH